MTRNLLVALALAPLLPPAPAAQAAVTLVILDKGRTPVGTGAVAYGVCGASASADAFFVKTTCTVAGTPVSVTTAGPAGVAMSASAVGPAPVPVCVEATVLYLDGRSETPPPLCETV